MFEKIKRRKLLKKLAIQGNRLEWIKKKRKNLPEQIEKKLDENIKKISDIFDEKIRAKNSDVPFSEEKYPKLALEYVKKALGETNYNMEHYFKKYRQNALWELFDELWLVVLVALILKFFVIKACRSSSSDIYRFGVPALFNENIFNRRNLFSERFHVLNRRVLFELIGRK